MLDPPRPCRPKTILLVEDDELVRLVALNMLKTLGHEVFEAEDAAAALARLGTTRIDVLVTDLGLPGMSGAELATEVHRRKPGIGIVFATGDDGDAGLDEVLRKTGAILLQKPYDVAAMAAAVHSSLPDVSQV